jgi:hypothetical protein
MTEEESTVPVWADKYVELFIRLICEVSLDSKRLSTAACEVRELVHELVQECSKHA